LLADEPTGNLDSKHGEAVMELLQDLHREGATICMVTHDHRYARTAGRVVHLFDGTIVDETQLERTTRDEAESAAQSFAGRSEMSRS
jgi:putative ABC transport system ATP-binding protein